MTEYLTGSTKINRNVVINYLFWTFYKYELKYYIICKLILIELH